MNYLSKIKKDGTFGENTMTETQLRNLALDIKDECHNIMLGFKKETSDGRMRSLTPKELRDIRLHNVKKLNAEGLRGVYEKLCDELESTPDVLRAFALEIFKLSPVGTSDNAVKTANSIMQQLIDEDLMMYYFAEEHKSIKDVRELTGFTAAKVSKAAERARKAGIEVPMAVRPKKESTVELICPSLRSSISKERAAAIDKYFMEGKCTLEIAYLTGTHPIHKVSVRTREVKEYLKSIGEPLPVEQPISEENYEGCMAMKKAEDDKKIKGEGKSAVIKKKIDNIKGKLIQEKRDAIREELMSDINVASEDVDELVQQRMEEFDLEAFESQAMEKCADDFEEMRAFCCLLMNTTDLTPQEIANKWFDEIRDSGRDHSMLPECTETYVEKLMYGTESEKTPKECGVKYTLGKDRDGKLAIIYNYYRQELNNNKGKWVTWTRALNKFITDILVKDGKVRLVISEGELSALNAYIIRNEIGEVSEKNRIRRRIWTSEDLDSELLACAVRFNRKKSKK